MARMLRRDPAVSRLVGDIASTKKYDPDNHDRIAELRLDLDVELAADGLRTLVTKPLSAAHKYRLANIILTGVDEPPTLPKTVRSRRRAADAEAARRD